MLNSPPIPVCFGCDARGTWVVDAYVCPKCGGKLSLDSQGGPILNHAPVTAQQIEAYAKTWLDTKYVHRGRSRLNGVDCIGLLRACAEHFQLSNHDFFNYAPTPDGRTLIREMDIAFGVDDGYDGHYNGAPYEIGDVLVFWIRKRNKPKHAGIFTRMSDGRPGIIHTYSTIGKVSIHGMDEWWLERIAKVYKWPGVK